MADTERLLIAEDDPPLRLVALALGAPLDAKMRTALSRYFTDDVDVTLGKLRAQGEQAGLLGTVVPELAAEGDLGPQFAGVHYLLCEGAEISDEVLAGGSSLRLIQKHGEDCRNLDLGAAARRGIPVATLRRQGNSDVAEHAFLLLLAVARRLLSAHQASANPPEGAVGEASSYNWARLDDVLSLRGLTLGLVGLGEIGRDMARKAIPFGMRMIYNQRRQLESELEHEIQVEYRSLPDLLAESDVVSLHLPFTPETRHLIGRDQLQQMRRGAILINTSRGALVDEQALVQALREGQIGGAGLDVRAEEPPADASALASLTNVVLTPHIAAGTGQAFIADVREVLENIKRVRLSTS